MIEGTATGPPDAAATLESEASADAVELQGDRDHRAAPPLLVEAIFPPEAHGAPPGPRPSGAPRRAGVKRQDTPRRGLPPVVMLEERGPSGEQVVQVTIGRIDVRTAVGPPPPVSAPPREPMLTLAEYLRDGRR
jgi:hypothetical protein